MITGGRVGIVVLPYYLVFEMLGAVVEMFGVAVDPPSPVRSGS